MSNIFWRPSGSVEVWGDNPTLEEIGRLIDLMVEYIESQGHTITVGTFTDSSDDVRQYTDPSDETDDFCREELNQLFNQAWEYATVHITT